ncbi:MSCRAMM family protein [Dethiobacter alkaliphilus]|uniref:MSCRAMM family protein n=1 Tax=Dethiobacter alkaliphilus TaxID=427926 RepID=UPI0022264FA7|nr:hypothetical protein [Dethiobacter alkaliphilus]MCW3489289.1 hypothetical protein [Dethiobacter alkaliphilus]
MYAVCEIGSITIDKTVTLDGDEIDFDEEFDFIILDSNEQQVGDIISVAAGEQSDPIALPLGEYTVTEIGFDEEYFHVVENNQTANLSGEESEITLEFENAIQTGTLTIEKVVTLDGDEADGDEIDDEVFEFVILDEDGEVYQNEIFLEAGESASFELPVGKYTVEEVNFDDEAYEVEVNDQEANIEFGEESDLIFNNIVITDDFIIDPEDPDVDDEEGTLIISKVVTLDGDEVENDEVFEFVILDSDEEQVGDIISVAAGEQSDPIELHLGQYTVTEINFDDEYYTVADNDQTANITEDGQDISLEFENAIQTGTLTIEKVVTLDGDEVDDDEVFEFVILDEAGEVYQNEIFLEAGESASFELPVGTYTVQEVNFDDEIYEVEVNSQEANIEFGEESDLTFNNIVITDDFIIDPEDPAVGDEEGTLIISKIVTRDGDEIEDDEEFEFVILLDGDEYDTVTVAGGESVSVQLPTGNFVVREVNIDEEYYEVQENDKVVTIEHHQESFVEFVNAIVITELEEEPEEALVDDEEEELPVTSGTDFLMMGLGLAMATGGMALRRRKRK